MTEADEPKNNCDIHQALPSGSEHATCKTAHRFSLLGAARSSFFINCASPLSCEKSNHLLFDSAFSRNRCKDCLRFEPGVSLVRKTLSGSGYRAFETCDDKRNYCHCAISSICRRLLSLHSTKLLLLLCCFAFLTLATVDSSSISREHSVSLSYPQSTISTDLRRRSLFAYLQRRNRAESNLATLSALERSKRSTEQKRKRATKRKGKKRKQTGKRNKRKGKRRKIKNRRKRPGQNTMHNRKQTFYAPKLMRLYNKMGSSFHIAVWRSGEVSGESSITRSKYTALEFKDAGGVGIVSIMGKASRKYICVSKNGKVKAKKKYRRKRCRFREIPLKIKQNLYESLSCENCYLNLNKKGKIKRLNRANRQLPESHFLPFRIDGKPLYSPATRGKVVTASFANYTGANPNRGSSTSFGKNRTKTIKVASSNEESRSIDGAAKFDDEGRTLRNQQIANRTGISRRLPALVKAQTNRLNTKKKRTKLATPSSGDRH